MNKKITAASVQAEYTKGKVFKENLGLYEQVKKNERFYLGEQWDGLKTSKIQPVTFNVLRRVTSLFQAQVVSDDISWEIRPYNRTDQTTMEGRALDEVVRKVYDAQNVKTLNRKVLRNGVVDGDMCMFFTWDPDIESGQMVKGDIRAEPVMNTNVYFGNPHTQDVQRQPYIIIARRRPLGVVKAEAKAAKVQDWDSIEPDSATEYVGGEEQSEYDQVTELTRFWKVKETIQQDEFSPPITRTRIHFIRVAGEVITVPDTETEMELYPIAWASWIERNNNMHGISPITEMIPTQIAINKQATYIGTYTQSMAMPKLVYNVNKLPNGWNGDPSKAIGVNGDPREAIVNPVGGIQLPSGVFETLNTYQTMMKDCMGASDTALGNINNPDNTSAILATQKASNAPLELQKRTFEQFNEDCIRIIVDMACAYYGQRNVTVRYKQQDAMGNETEQTADVTIDFDRLTIGALDINVEVGAASYWSELVAMTNMDKLMQAKLIPDPVLYLESIPNTYIPNKQDIIEAVKRAQQQAQQQQAMQAAMQQAQQAQQAQPMQTAMQ